MKQLTNQHGVALMGVLMAVTILGLMSGIAGSTWTTIVQRAKEQELLWRGDQYRQALESYYTTTKVGGHPKQLPSSLENLVKDPRSVTAVRHLRDLYLDPITGEDWVVIKDPSGKIKGVRSSSKKEPFKKDGFSEVNKDFAEKESYSEWEFIFDVKTVKKDKGTKGGTSTSGQGTGGSGSSGASGQGAGSSSSKSPFSGSPLTGSPTN